MLGVRYLKSTDRCLPSFLNNEPVFIDRDGERFVYVLDYMLDGKASLPVSISKTSFISDLKYYGIDTKDSVSILMNSGTCASQLFLCMKNHDNHIMKRLDFKKKRMPHPCYSKQTLENILSTSIRKQDFHMDLPDFFQGHSVTSETSSLFQEILKENGVHVDIPSSKGGNRGWGYGANAKIFMIVYHDYAIFGFVLCVDRGIMSSFNFNKLYISIQVVDAFAMGSPYHFNS
jgi:BTB/POZ domain